LLKAKFDGNPSDNEYDSWIDYLNYETGNGNIDSISFLYEKALISQVIDTEKIIILINLKSVKRRKFGLIIFNR
jgi:hypothetical protein